MMKYIITLITFAFCCSVFGDYVSQDHPLHNIELEARTEKIDYKNSKKYIVNKDDSLANCFRKLIILDKCFRKEKGRSKVASIFDKSAKIAYENFPNEAVIASVFVARNHSVWDYIKGLRIIIPFVQEIHNVHHIAAELWVIFTAYQYNIDKKRIQEDLVYLLKTDNKVEQLKQLKLLQQYWIALDEPTAVRNPTLVLEAKKAMTPEKRREALAVWETVVNQCFKEDERLLESNIRSKIYAEQNQQIMDQIAKKEKFRQKLFEKAIKDLDVFEKAPNSLKKMQMTFPHLRTWEERLRKYKQIPNYKKLKNIYKNSQEAELLNCAFLTYALNDYNLALKQLRELKQNDPRVLMIQIYCMYRLYKPKTDILSLVNELIAINPQNIEAKVLKIKLENDIAKEKSTTNK